MSCNLNTLLRKKSGFGPGPRHHIEGPNATIRSLQGKVRWRRAGWDPPLPVRWIWWTPSKNHLSTWESVRQCKMPSGIVERSILASLPLYVLLQYVTIMILGNHQSIWAPCPFQGVARSLWTSPKCHPRTRSSATSPWAQSHASLHPNLWILACQYRLKRWLETSYLLNCPHHIHHGHGKTIVLNKIKGKAAHKQTLQQLCFADILEAFLRMTPVADKGLGAMIQ